jgi:ATP-dependent Clp protease protease subunit
MKTKTFVFAPVILALVVGCASENQKNFEGVINREEKPRMEQEGTGELQRKPTSGEEKEQTNLKKNSQQKITAILDFSGSITIPKSTEFNILLKKIFLDGNVDEIIIYINSDGGNSNAGLAIYNSIKSIPISVTTVNTGVVGSAAVWMYCGGNSRYAMPNTNFSIHGSTINDADINSDIQLEYYIKLHKKFYEFQRNVLKSCSSMSKSMIDEYIRSSENRYLTVYDAKDFGITQKIGSPELKVGEKFIYHLYTLKD